MVHTVGGLNFGVHVNLWVPLGSHGEELPPAPVSLHRIHSKQRGDAFFGEPRVQDVALEPHGVGVDV